MRVEGAKGQKTLQQHGFDLVQYCEAGTERDRNQYSSRLPSAEAMIGPSDYEIAIEGLSGVSIKTRCCC